MIALCRFLFLAKFTTHTLFLCVDLSTQPIQAHTWTLHSNFTPPPPNPHPLSSEHRGGTQTDDSLLGVTDSVQSTNSENHSGLKRKQKQLNENKKGKPNQEKQTEKALWAAFVAGERGGRA